MIVEDDEAMEGFPKHKKFSFGFFYYFFVLPKPREKHMAHN